MHIIIAAILKRSSRITPLFGFKFHLLFLFLVLEACYTHQSKMKKNLKIPMLTGFLALFMILPPAKANPGIRLRVTDKGLQFGECRYGGLTLFIIRAYGRP